MKIFNPFLLSLLMAIALISCGDDYDDTALRNDVNDLKSRVEQLESWCSTANSQISALQGLVSALQENDYVTGVSPVVDPTTGEETGYTIAFSKSSPITIMHGKDGDDGKDGNTPIIGVQQADDGKYYWTVKTGEAAPAWLTDAEGNKIRTTGDDGAKPVISVDTADGRLYWKIDGEWLLDSDGKKVPATGEKGATGSTGPQGPQGPQGDAVFAAKGVDLTDPAFVTFTLAGGKTTFTVARTAPLTMGKDGVIIYPASHENYKVTVTLPTDFTDEDYVSIMAEVKGSFGTSTDVKARAANGNSAGWKVTVDEPTFTEGRGRAVVTLTAPKTADSQVDVAPVWLEVTLLDSKGMKYTATCAVKVMDVTIVSTADELIKALMADKGTAGAPVRIVLANDLTVTEKEVDEATENPDGYFLVKGCKVLDGAGFTLTNGSDNKGRNYVIKIDADGVSLEITNLTIKDVDVRTSTFFYVQNKARLTLGKGVSFVTKEKSNNIVGFITVDFGGTLVLDGAKFSCEAGSFGEWISLGGSDTGNLVLKSFSFAGDDDYIYGTMSGSEKFSMAPGIASPVPLAGMFFTKDFVITPTAGEFTTDDVARLSFLPTKKTWVDATSAVGDPNGDQYEFYLDETTNTIRLRLKGAVMTFAELVAAIDAADGTAAEPTQISLGANIEFEAPADGPGNSITLPKGKHIAIDGGPSKFEFTRADAQSRFFWVKDGASLRLTNLTVDGENVVGNSLFWVGDVNPSHPDGPGLLTLGSGCTLKGAAYNDNSSICGIAVVGTLVMEGDAAITGNGDGWAVSLNGNEGPSLHLKGGSIKDNSGENLYLFYNAFAATAPTITVDAALPATSAYVLTLDQYIKADGSIACETVVTGGSGYTLTAADLARFTLKTICKQDSYDYTAPDGYELWLDADANAIKLRATNGIGLPDIASGGAGLQKR